MSGDRDATGGDVGGGTSCNDVGDESSELGIYGSEQMLS